MLDHNSFRRENRFPSDFKDFQINTISHNILCSHRICFVTSEIMNSVKPLKSLVKSHENTVVDHLCTQTENSTLHKCISERTVSSRHIRNSTSYTSTKKYGSNKSMR